MEAPPYTDTILLQANRKSSAEYLGGSDLGKSSWTNDLGSGIKLDIGDEISVHSAYISEIGNEDSTIEIKGRIAINNLGERQSYTTKTTTLTKLEGQKNNGSSTYKLQTTEGNYSWEYNASENTHQITDDALYLTHSYYKCAQGDNYISLPRAWGADDRRAWWDGAQDWNASNTSKTGAVHSPNPYRLGTDYSFVRTFGNPANGYGYETNETTIGQDRTEISNDGRRYTLFVRKSFKNYTPEGEKTGFTLQGERDPALMDFIWYRKTVKYEVSKGFNSPANVATQITNKMNDINEIVNVSLGEDNDPDTNTRKDGQIKQNNLNLQAQSNTFETFPCSNAWFIRNAGELWFNDTYSDDFNVPMFFGGSGDGDIAPEQNLFNLGENGGTFEGTTYTAGHMWENGQVKVGWKFKYAKRTDTNQIYTLLNQLVGAEICGIRDNRVSGETGTWVKMNKEITANPGTELIRNPGAGHLYYWNMSNEDLAMYFDSCYSTVGYLRPEIQEYGRELMKDEDFERTTIDGSFLTYIMRMPLTNPYYSANKSTILTGIPWTEENLIKLKNFIESQELYPELFDWDGMSASQQALINVTEANKADVSPDKMRFLHMNDGSQEGTLEQEIDDLFVTYVSATRTTLGAYIEIRADEINTVVRGMRIIDSQRDTPTERFLPKDTFVTKVDYINNYIYISNDYSDNASLVPQHMILTSAGLGSDNYSNASDVVTYNHKAGAVFFDYNPARKDIIGGEGKGADPYETLTYGFAKKYNLNPGEKVYYIGLSVEKYQSGTIPDIWKTNPTDTEMLPRCIGFDKHFNAYGTCAILLTNGYASLWGAPYSASGVDYPNVANSWAKTTTNMSSGSNTPFPDLPTMYKVVTNQPNYDGWFKHSIADDPPRYGPCPDAPSFARLFNEIYCGANQPTLSFSGDSSRFSFQNLHTAELKGTNAEEIEGSTDVAGANSACYKINKRLSRLNYSPNFTPYNNVFKIYSAGEYNASTTIAEKDNSITPYTIMDAQSGIFIEDYGCDEKNWGQSLWELLGFTYSQFHNKGSRLQRFNNTGLNTATPTTNALIKTEDLQTFVKLGTSGLSVFNTLEVNYPSWRYDSKNGSGATHWNPYASLSYEAFPGFQSYPAVTEVGAKSTSIIADNLPRKMLSPIYLIKSDLLNPMYIGGREGTSSLPVIAVVDKSSGYGDFYTGATDSTIFTNTIPRTIQNIKTSIVDADGSESRVDDSCCVIYKITKQIKNNSVVLTNILNPPKK
jgi:hypothetical protein